jgi:hypothetical protein
VAHRLGEARRVALERREILRALPRRHQGAVGGNERIDVLRPQLALAVDPGADRDRAAAGVVAHLPRRPGDLDQRIERRGARLDGAAQLGIDLVDLGQRRDVARHHAAGERLIALVARLRHHRLGRAAEVGNRRALRLERRDIGLGPVAADLSHRGQGIGHRGVERLVDAAHARHGLGRNRRWFVEARNIIAALDHRLLDQAQHRPGAAREACGLLGVAIGAPLVDQHEAGADDRHRADGGDGGDEERTNAHAQPLHGHVGDTA